MHLVKSSHEHIDTNVDYGYGHRMCLNVDSNELERPSTHKLGAGRWPETDSVPRKDPAMEAGN